jgi:GMP synthase (glutamine-hydrolysing)
MASQDVIVIQHAAPEHLGSIEPALRAFSLAPLVLRPYAGEAVPRFVGDAAGLVVLGGAMGVYEQGTYPHLTDEIALIRDALRSGTPVLGVCLGSQLLAAALGAEVKPGPAKEIGWHDVSLTEAAARDALFAGVPSRFAGFHWHGDVYPVPAGSVPLAYSAMTACQGFRHGELSYGLLFHLEMTAAMIEDWVATSGAELRAAEVAPSDVLAGLSDRVARLSAIGEMVFTRWAELAARER